MDISRLFGRPWPELVEEWGMAELLAFYRQLSGSAKRRKARQPKPE